MKKNNRLIKKSSLIKNENGFIYKLVDLSHFKKKKISESYISTIKKNSIKAWKFHKKNTLNLFVIKGKVIFVIFTDGKFYKYIIDDTTFSRLTITNKMWYGFMGLNSNESQILCFTDYMHNEKEMLRKNINEIYFDWDKYK